MTNSDTTLRPQAESHGSTGWPTAALLGSVLLASTGCSTPPGRCGMPGLCDPVAMTDPFPNDQCVPPKGVDPGHSGYTRPAWRVLDDRDPVCCFPTTAAIPSVPDSPAPAEQLPSGTPEPLLPQPHSPDDWSGPATSHLHFSDVVPPPRRVPLN